MPDSSRPPRFPLEDGWDVTERRGYARYLARARAHVVERATLALLGQLLDISGGGFRMLATKPVPPARRHHLTLYLQIAGRDRVAIEVIARCAWHRARPQHNFEAGFEFVELTELAREQIAAFVDALDA